MIDINEMEVHKDDLIAVDIVPTKCGIQHQETMNTILAYNNLLLYILLLLFLNFILVGMLGIVVYNEHNEFISLVVGMATNL
jgi:hypothetical protein